LRRRVVEGTSPVTRYLLDLAVEDEIQAWAAQAPPMTEDQCGRLAGFLRLDSHLG
jgi:hypothetical protein